jgi:hypothetical protein
MPVRRECRLMAVSIGDRFTRLEVISELPRRMSSGRPRPWWLCRCDCGAIKEVAQSNLVYRYVQSCGCLRADKASEIGKASVGRRAASNGKFTEFEGDWDDLSRAMDRAYVAAVRAAHPEVKFIEVVECKSQHQSWHSSSPSRSVLSGRQSRNPALLITAG